MHYWNFSQRYLKFLLLPAVVSACGFWGSVARAQMDAQQRAAMADRALAVKDTLSAERLPTLEAAQQAVIQEVSELDSYLRSQTSEQNRDAWFAYLSPDALLQAIADDAQATQQAQLAQDLQYRMSRNLDGLDLTPMQELRAALRQLQAAVRFRERDRSIEQLREQLDRLAERLREMDDVPTAEDAAGLSIVLELLGEAGQGEAVESILGDAFSRPNVRVLVGETLIDRVAARPVNQTQPINECSDGARTTGQVTLNGFVNANLVPSYDTVRIQVQLTANFMARTVVAKHPVRVNVAAAGNVMASRVLLVNEQGIQLEPTYAQAYLDSDILGVNHHLRLVRTIAARRAAEEQPEAERQSVRKIQQQVGTEFDQQTAQFGSQQLDLPFADVEDVFARLDVTPPSRQLYASDDFVVVDLRQQEDHQVLALNSPPGLSLGTYVGGQLHESAIHNIGSRVLAGRTMTQSQIETLLDSLKTESDKPRPEPFVNPQPAEPSEPTVQSGESEAASEPFEIDFARFRPLIFEARDDTVRVGVRGTRFNQGGRELQRAIEITAIYKPVTFEDKVYLMRQGDVDVSFPGGRRLSVTQVAIKSNIQRAFGNAFPAAILNRPIELPLEQIGGLTIYPRNIIARDGWLSVSFR